MLNPFKIINPVLVSVLFMLQSGLPISAAEILRGRVVDVHDGDTVTLLIGGNRLAKIRLAQIDAPESGQAFGQLSTQSLYGMVFNKNISLLPETVDDHGRIVGLIFVDGIDVSREQVRRGMAWAYRQYLHDPSLLQVEQEARRARAGLWSKSRPMPPWRYRHGDGSRSELSEPSATPAPASPQVNDHCGNKRYCKEMASCNEARFYLNECGLMGLDRDHDGVPCENVCGKGR